MEYNKAEQMGVKAQEWLTGPWGWWMEDEKRLVNGTKSLPDRGSKF